MKQSLAVQYRPKDFDSCVGQETVIKILKQQLSTKTIKNTYMFTGSSGTGKTTLARIFANEINGGYGTPIEIDGASNNGVDNVRNIIDRAKERSLDSEYRIFIIDESHSITNQGWQAFLKCIEEPPKYTIFMFCTTNPEKIPDTIMNRCMRFNLQRVSFDNIVKRLNYICEQEGFCVDKEGIEYITHISNGSVRQAIAYLEKCCSGFVGVVSISDVLEILGNFSHQTYFDLTNAIIDGDCKTVVSIVDKCFNDGKDLRVFISQYLEFLLDLNKYCIFNRMDIIGIPTSMEKQVKYTTGIENNTKYFNKLMNKVMELHNNLKTDVSPKTTVSIVLLQLCIGE